jgi:hypothetical protein
MRIGFIAVHEAAVGTSRTSQDVRLESAKWGKADLDQVVTNRNFMSTRPNTTLADFERRGIPKSVFQ